MSINQSHYKYSLQGIVDALKVIAGGDMASVQINSDGTCILRSGITHTEHLTVEQFATVMDEEVRKSFE